MTEVAAAIALLAIPNYTLRDNHLDVAMVIRWLLACGYVVEKVLESRVHVLKKVLDSVNYYNGIYYWVCWTWYIYCGSYLTWHT